MKNVLAVATALTLSMNVQAEALNTDKVLAAQQAWSEGIVAIGAAKQEGGDYQNVARDMISNLYAYGQSPVLFKPTKASDDQFRGTFEEAHSYFVKGAIAEDNGFAINPWTDVRFENEHIMVDGDMALAMGNYYFTDVQGTETKVEYTFGYKLDANEQLRIVLHHSSLPYSGGAPAASVAAN